MSLLNRMKEHKLFVIASLLLSRAWATTVDDALNSSYADCYDPSGTCSCTSIGVPAGSPGADFSQITEEHCNGDSARFFCTEGRR